MTVCSVKLLVAEARGSGWNSTGRPPYWIISSPIQFQLCVRPCVCAGAQSFSLLWSHWLQLSRHLCPWNLPARNTGVGSHALLQGIFQTQGSNLCLLHCRQILDHWATKEAHSLPQTMAFTELPSQHPQTTLSCPFPLLPPLRTGLSFQERNAPSHLSNPFTDFSLLLLFRTVLNWFPPY